jgi:hypothetical protein
MLRAARNVRHASAALRDGKSRELSEGVRNFCSRRLESCVQHKGWSEKDVFAGRWEHGL